MKWIVFALVSFVKISIISILVLLSVAILPIIALILSLGMALGAIRDHEHGLYNNIFSMPQGTQRIFDSIKTTCHYLFAQQALRLQHYFMLRLKIRS